MFWSLRDGVTQESANDLDCAMWKSVSERLNTEALGIIDDVKIFLGDLIIIYKKLIDFNYIIKESLKNLLHCDLKLPPIFVSQFRSA